MPITATATAATAGTIAASSAAAGAAAAAGGSAALLAGGGSMLAAGTLAGAGATTAAAGMSAGTIASLAATGISSLAGVAGTIMSAKNASAQAKSSQAQANYQAKIAEKNAELAREQESAQLRQAYENSLTIKRKGAKLIGSQRAISGASGLATDVGSLQDTEVDTAMQVWADAASAYNSGVDKAYNTELQAWGYGQQSKGYSLLSDAYSDQARAARTAGLINGVGTLAGGIADMGKTDWGLRARYPTGQKPPDNTYGGWYDTNTGMNAGTYGTRRYVQPRADGSFSFYR